MPVLVTLAGRRRVDASALVARTWRRDRRADVLQRDHHRFVLDASRQSITAWPGRYALRHVPLSAAALLDATKPMAAAGDPVRAEAFESAWVHSARFRAIERAMTRAWGSC